MLRTHPDDGNVGVGFWCPACGDDTSVEVLAWLMEDDEQTMRGARVKCLRCEHVWNDYI